MTSQLNYKTTFIRHTLKPSIARAFAVLLLLNFAASCSSFRIPTRKSKGDISIDGYQEMSVTDYSDHLASLKEPFLTTPGIKVFKIDESTKKYLTRLANEIIFKNEIFFKNLKTAQTTILEMEAPLHFSLPKGEIFLSKSLISKYIKHESMLVSIISYELVRSEKILYPKNTFIPLGYLPLERFMSLNRLTLDEKMEVHKWAYHLTLRSGYDGEYYLSWLQIQNRNTADFITQVGDANYISREESLFKAFLIKNTNDEKINTRKNSSKYFYTFLNSIRDGAI